MPGEKTEKATPKARYEARQKGSVARSVDLTGAIVLMSSLMALSSFGPGILVRMENVMVTFLNMTSHPAIVDEKGLGSVMLLVGQQVILAVLPIVAVCVAASLVANVGQVGFKPARKAIIPDFKRLDPAKGAKHLLSPNSIVELGKNLIKISLVTSIVVLTLMPKLNEVAALVGMPAADLLPELCKTVLHLAQRAAMVYLAIGAADFFYQRYRHEKSMKMDKQSVKDEYESQDLPKEVKQALRQRAFEMSRARMMDAVPTADVVVVNPTHYSVALKYDSDNLAPIVVAKGVDLIAFKIRELAAEHGVAVVPDPPLARTLYANVEVGKMIPEDLFQAVAQLLAYVYRVAGATRAQPGRERSERGLVAA
jgi:flagellar biosynthetic protein FlhB